MFSVVGGFDNRSCTISSFNYCPYCGSEEIKKNGKAHSHQRWLCHHCHRSFSSRNETILFSSKLKPGQLRKIISLLSDGVLVHQVSHQADVSIQTVILWKRKLQHLVKNQDSIVLSGNVWVDETYINVPMKERRKESKRGLSKNKLQIAVGVDSQNKVIALINQRGMPSNSDSEKVFNNHIAPGSIVRSDEGHYGTAFQNCINIQTNSKSVNAKRDLNPINRICALVQRLFYVHSRIHHKNRQKYLDEFVSKYNEYNDKNFASYMNMIYSRIFFSQKSFRRKEISTS